MVFDLSIVDLQLIRQDGISLMEEFHLILPDMPVIILTAYGSIESAVEAMKRGAYSYLTKPFDDQDLLLQIERALENRRLTIEIKRLKGLLEERYNFTNIVARSEKMRRFWRWCPRSPKRSLRSISTGKVGQEKNSLQKPSILPARGKTNPLSQSTVPPFLKHYWKASFLAMRKGLLPERFEAKKVYSRKPIRDTFLDEIGDMPLSIQAKLLRTLQERQFYPVGSEKPVEVDVRVIVATQKDLESDVKQGQFREDLFYRIHVIPIYLPPLRERKEDIPPLVEYFLKKFSQQMKKR